LPHAHDTDCPIYKKILKTKPLCVNVTS